MELKNKLEEAVKLILESENIFIASHINPDGDNLGSTLALYNALKKVNKNVTPLISDFIPEDFKFLPGIEDMVHYEESDKNIDLLITLDSSDENRLGDNHKLLDEDIKILNIDHHISNNNFGDINIVVPESPSTCELVFKLIKALDIEIDLDIAENLYTGISTDTGKFSYDSVTGQTHRIVAELIDTGLDFNKININLYESISLEKMRLDIEALSSLTTYHDNKVGVVKVTQKMLEKTGTTMEDSNGIVEQIRKIKGIEVACLLKENKKNEVKVSMRSKEYYNVAEVCELFGGGGHIRAAGCTINESINKSEKLIIDAIGKNI